MRDKPLRSVGARLFRKRRDASSHGSRKRSGPDETVLDIALVDAFIAGTLDPQGEATLAQQVAGLMPFHWDLPNKIAEALARLTDHLDGPRALLAWLDRHPGRPRLAARLYVLVELLDQYSARPAVVTAVREVREQTPYPPGLEHHLVPPTDDETLAGLGSAIESLLGDDRPEDAVALARATVAMVQQAAPRAAELDHEVRDLGELMEHVEQDILAAGDDS
ncbi:hypothetical protein [Streptomyces sp. bgisy100]|uniref:hypothetical protein n=1 Tax=Streptomyces sp. bgisy100 TaxID=3413783 RepID=UPI003D7447F3